MISMFAFIVALGIVVDDAIVVGENIYEYRNRGMTYRQAAIQGARDVMVPVVFSILTNIVAFLPLMFIPGFMGKIWIVIPMVVITVFSISLFECLFILPAHLAPVRQKPDKAVLHFIHVRQQRFSKSYERFIQNRFGPFLDFCIKWRTLTLAASFAILIIVIGYVLGGRIGTTLMPRVESDYSVVTATLPVGSPLEHSRSVSKRLTQAAYRLIEKNGGEKLSKGVFTEINENTVEARIYLTEPDIRPISTAKITELWRQAVGEIAGLQMLRFEADRGGPGGGASLTVELSHRNIDVLDRASADLAEILADFPNVKDIDDGYTPGKEQIAFKITLEGQALGLTVTDIARQVRYAFYGAEALRQQRGRNEVRVRVILPENQRNSEYDLEQLLITTSQGKYVPLMQVAEVERGRSYTSIDRRNARRTVTVTANATPDEEATLIQEKLSADILPRMSQKYPGLSYGFEGRQADMAESMGSLTSGFIIAILMIYVLLAIPFKSYFQPMIVMMAIPFGIVGAVLGHVIMGYGSLSIMSLMGIVALSGVVVNDSLVLISAANEMRKQNNLTAFEAIHQAGIRRFRPIMLTTLTTFGGLSPMIMETSRQARFMIPMAISLGFGILFATGITLVVCTMLVYGD